MKKMGILALVLFLTLTLVPMGAQYLSATDTTNANESAVLTDTSSDAQLTQDVNEVGQTQTAEEILVCMATSGTVVGLTTEEYVIGVVAGEMPASYEEQALMAQAAASMNLARIALQNGTQTELNGGHISSSSAVAQAYLTKEQMQQKWGDDFDVFYARIQNAVRAVADYEIVYREALCQTCFHAVSAGRTENSENVWQEAVPYLVAVDSSFDKTAANYSTSMQIPADDFANALQEYGFEPTQTARMWLGESEYSDSGTLLALEVGNITVSGAQLRAAFGLRSAAVTVIYEDGEFILTANGYGHGVGMSQYGAQQMALQGYTWQEIIRHYYTGVEIQKVS